jgi:hypothetical protein
LLEPVVEIWGSFLKIKISKSGEVGPICFCTKFLLNVSKLFFPDLKKGKQNTAPSEKNQNKTKLLPLKALASGDARPEGRRRRRRREHGVGRKHLPAMSRTTLLAADGRRVVVVGGELTTIELTVSNAI